MERSRVAIIIPALNEGATISTIISKAVVFGIVIVVDDGSTDNTAETARHSGATVVSHSKNLGYDAALNSGFSYALKIGCTKVLTIDADGQHDTTIIGRMIKELDDGAEVVIGIRDKRQRLAEHIFAWFTRIRWGIRDPLCGQKAYRIEIYRELGHFDSVGSIGTELALFAARSGKDVRQIEVPTYPRSDTPRFGRCFAANCRIFRALFYVVFRVRFRSD